MAITLDALKKTLDNVAPLVQFPIKIMFNPEIGFIGNAHRCRVLFKINAGKKLKSRFAIKRR